MTSKKSKKLLLVFGLVALIISTVFMTNYKHKEVKVSAETVSLSRTQLFINEIAGTASQIAQANDLYASVMIAQAILESNSGQSGLSVAPNNNFFGIKGAYNGASVTMLTWEDDGNGNAYETHQPFRSYPSIADSLADYARLLNSPIYAGVRRSNTLSYQDATAALTGVYATDTSYNAKLNSIIQTYGLTAYDVAAPVAADSSATNASSTGIGGNQATIQSVWNAFRRQYTSAEILAEDQAWSEFKKGH
ncbi:glucosaminidase domain-containing protein [Streptococcus hongkongensis]|nr:N-acetylmuramidase [Streptococcus uberis]